MSSLFPGQRSRIRTLLVLARASNITTVWSNCLAAWLLCGGGPIARLLLVTLGGTLVYFGGMFLNDAFDADFDRRFKKDRPIASGWINEREVWIWGWGLLGTGALLMILPGTTAAIFTLLLCGFILLYNATHKLVAFSPVLMAACRWALFLAVGAAASDGVSGASLWAALVLAAYIVGLSYIARRETIVSPIRYWPLILLLSPLLPAWLANGALPNTILVVFSVIFLAWTLNSVRYTLWTSGKPQIGRTVSYLLAGIVLVDALASQAAQTPLLAVAFAALFGLALLAQVFIPAT